MSQNIQTEYDLKKIFSKYDGFADKPLKYKYHDHVGHHTLNQIQLEVDIQLDNGYYLNNINLLGPIEIEYSWSEYQPQTWDYPGNPGGLQEISAVQWPFTKNLNDKENDKLFKLSIDTGNTETTDIKLSELSVKDRYTIFEKLEEYIQSEQFFDYFYQVLQKQAEDAKAEAEYQQSQDDYYY